MPACPTKHCSTSIARTWWKLARTCFDEELARRQLKAPSPVAAVHAPLAHDDAEELAVVETYESQEEAKLARELLRAAGIRAQLGAGGLALLVPISTREDAREVLDAQVSDEELAEAAAAAPRMFATAWERCAPISTGIST